MATSKAFCQEKVPTSYDALENNHEVVFSEIEDRVWCLQLDKEEKNLGTDVFMEDGDVAPSRIIDQETKDGGWSCVKETIKDETLVKEEKKEVVHDETGLAGAIKRPLGCIPTEKTIKWGMYKLLPEQNILGSWKMKREKRRQRSPEELKNFDTRTTFSSSVKRMREAQAKMGGQSIVEKDFAAGGFTTSDRSELMSRFAYRLV